MQCVVFIGTGFNFVSDPSCPTKMYAGSASEIISHCTNDATCSATVAATYNAANPSTITVSQPDMSVDAIADMSVIFGLCMLALAGVWGMKQLINLFTVDKAD